jgi:hypothetical protein
VLHSDANGSDPAAQAMRARKERIWKEVRNAGVCVIGGPESVVIVDGRADGGIAPSAREAHTRP